jgi:outer membrane immunogenic protein
MKRVLCCGVSLAALFLAGAADAADVFSAAPAYPSALSPVPFYNWGGLYVGINGGGGFANGGWQDGVDNLSGSWNGSSGLIGGTVGYNAQTLAPFVFGEEVDLDAVRYHTSFTAPACGSGCEFRSDWVGTARLRFGWALDPFLPYVTGGLSFGQLSADIIGFPVQSKINLGWTAGFGLEYLLADRWTAKIEYLYMDHSGISCESDCAYRSISFKLNENVVKFGVNYRLWER